MFKIYIADLNKNNIKGIQGYINNNLTYVKMEKAFFDEQSFYNEFNPNEKQILLLELKFFSGNFFKKIKDFIIKNPSINIVLYGKFEEQDYMKKLSQQKQVNYIIRPVKPANLKKIIDEIIENHQKNEGLSLEELKIEQSYRQNINIFEQKFLNTLISGRIHDEDEIKRSFNYFNNQIKNGIVVSIVRVNSFRNIISDLDEKQKHILIFKILKIINNNVINGIAFINLFNEVVIIFNGVESVEDTIPILKEIKILVKTDLDIGVSIGVGRFYQNLKDIYTSFNEANNALMYRFVIERNSVISIDEVEPLNRYTANYPFERERKLVEACVVGNKLYSIKIIEQIFNELNKADSIYSPIISKIIMSIIMDINRTCAEKELKINDYNKFFPTQQILQLNDLKTAYQFIKNGIESFCDYISDFRKNQENELFQKIINYVEEKYYNSITYKAISEEFNCNTDYLKKVFEENAQESIYDYLHKYRIKKAKELILSTNLTDDIIAANIGYEDVSTFRKIFKNIEGCLVGDFRYVHK